MSEPVSNEEGEYEGEAEDASGTEKSLRVEYYTHESVSENLPPPPPPSPEENPHPPPPKDH